MKNKVILIAIVAAAGIALYFIFRQKNANNSSVGTGSPTALNSIRSVNYESAISPTAIANSVSQLLRSFGGIFGGGSNENAQPAQGSPALPAGYGTIPATSGGSYEGAPSVVTQNFAGIFGSSGSVDTYAQTNYAIAPGGPFTVSDGIAQIPASDPSNFFDSSGQPIS